MHLQASVEGYDVFTRSLSVGPQTLVAEYEPAREYFERYEPEPDLSPELARDRDDQPRRERVLPLGAELVRGDREGRRGHPIDYANASPDLSLVSLNYLFLGDQVARRVVRLLLRPDAACWITQDLRDYVAIADADELTLQRLERYRALADSTSTWSGSPSSLAGALPSLDEHVVEYVESAAFDDLLVRVIQEGEPPELHERLIEHSRTRVTDWVRDQQASRVLVTSRVASAVAATHVATQSASRVRVPLARHLDAVRLARLDHMQRAQSPNRAPEPRAGDAGE